MIVIDNRNPFLVPKKRQKWRGMYCPASRWGYLVEQKGNKVVICLSTGEQITEDSKYWSGFGIERKEIK